MSYVSVWVHIVWSTKNREPVLINSVRGELFRHIRDNARQKGIHVDFINGYLDHVHALVSLGASQTISNVVQHLKGESAHWANQQGLVRGGLEWQSEYGAFSVNASSVDSVREYIANQAEHHRVKTFAQECEEVFGAIGDAGLSRD
jgi:putative transposase